MIKFRLNTTSPIAKNIILFVLFIGFFTFQGCSSSPEEIGIGIDPELSENNLTFTSEGGKKEIYTKKDFGTLMYKEKNQIISIEKKPWIDFSSLTTEWMSIDRTSDKNIEINVLKNDTNKERVDSFFVFNGDWFGKVIIKQEAYSIGY